MGPLERCHFDSNFEALLQRASDNWRVNGPITHFFCRGVPPDRPIPDLPVERPDFDLLYPCSSSETPTTRESGSGGSDIEITDKYTCTWVSKMDLSM